MRTGHNKCNKRPVRTAALGQKRSLANVRFAPKADMATAALPALPLVRDIWPVMNTYQASTGSAFVPGNYLASKQEDRAGYI
jgi:hypothetical protein